MKKRITKRVISEFMPVEGKVVQISDSEVRGLVVRASPGGKKAYCVLYRNSEGRRMRFAIGDATIMSPPQARDAARRVLADVAAGNDPAEEKRARRKANTLGEFLEGPYAEWAASNLRDGDLRVRRFKSAFPDFLDKKLSEITA